MSNYDSKDSEILGRQLDAQRVVVDCNFVTATSDLPVNVVINSATLTAAVITLDVKEPVKKVFAVYVRNRATGADVAYAAAPSLAVANKISITLNGTGLTDASVEFVYAVA
jgi:hypothetical protein